MASASSSSLPLQDSRWQSLYRDAHPDDGQSINLFQHSNEDSILTSGPNQHLIVNGQSSQVKGDPGWGWTVIVTHSLTFWIVLIFTHVIINIIFGVVLNFLLWSLDRSRQILIDLTALSNRTLLLLLWQSQIELHLCAQNVFSIGKCDRIFFWGYRYHMSDLRLEVWAWVNLIRLTCCSTLMKITMIII